MEWYYAVGDERRGPVNAGEFQRLVGQGTVTAQTLVWREGMTDWQPHGTVTPPPISSHMPVGGVVCANCGGNFSETEVIPLAGRMYCAACKPVVVQRLQEGLPSSTGGEEIRREYLKHEASVKSIGLLYYLGGAALLVMAVVAIVSQENSMGGVGALAGVFFFILGAGQIVVATGLRRLKSWARIPTAILSGLGLLGFPIGTIINAYVLYLVFCKKGKMVFSAEYRDIIAQTPHIKYRTSIVIWILLGLIVVVIGFALLAPLLARMARH